MMYGARSAPVMKTNTVRQQLMPNVKGMGLKDALYPVGKYGIESATERKGQGIVTIRSTGNHVDERIIGLSGIELNIYSDGQWDMTLLKDILYKVGIRSVAGSTNVEVKRCADRFEEGGTGCCFCCGAGAHRQMVISSLKKQLLQEHGQW